MTTTELNIFKDIPANLLTPSIMDFFAEASVVCLDNQGHKSGVIFEVVGYINKNIVLSWETEVTPQMKDAWNDLQDATEDGASYLAILIIHHFTPYKVIKRAVKKTGIDYWLGEKEDEQYPFQNKARLEISGILQENKKNAINKRVDIKLAQTEQSDNLNLPAYIVIIEFSKPQSQVAKK
jgi:hypothetical protein